MAKMYCASFYRHQKLLQLKPFSAGAVRDAKQTATSWLNNNGDATHVFLYDIEGAAAWDQGVFIGVRHAGSPRWLLV